MLYDPRPWWPLTDADDLREELVAVYASPQRGYHDVQHLVEVLTRLDELGEHGAVVRHLPVVLAAWFHDAVYDGERDAEERSAAWAEDALTGRVEPDLVEEVVRLVRLTETHTPEPDDTLGCLLSDADLAILAAPQERYDEYVAAVRAEFAHLDDATFAEGRAQVLLGLAQKPTLFHTAYARERWEDDARANLGAELERLGVQDVPGRRVS
ncbi:MAG: hypothetical protein ABF306_12165 [Nocardioides marinisabuli]|uniref:HD domain-containing protein n=1 Tax=Nocardioides marinisabuli TaxID=419476 RepID=UPI0032193B13